MMSRADSAHQLPPAMVVRVAKVGGSLLDRAELPAALRNWLAAQSAGHWVLVAGGGAIVETIRHADRRHQLGEATSHWLAIAAMRVTARWLATLLPEAQLVETWSELGERVLSPGVTVFDAEQFLREVEPEMPGRKLPESWDVTSDSIAARLAMALSASELVLLKSAWPSKTHARLSELSAVGYVDRFLPTLEDEMPSVRCVGLHPERARFI